MRLISWKEVVSLYVSELDFWPYVESAFFSAFLLQLIQLFPLTPIMKELYPTQTQI